MVSIACVTYNHIDWIKDALDGFLMQKTDFKYEVLIHDDCSTDGTSDIIRTYQKKHPDMIKAIIQTENQYTNHHLRRMQYRFNFNRAKGKYIAMCDGDDYWTDELKLQKQVDYLEAHDACHLCIHAAKVEGPEGEFIKLMSPYDKDYNENKIFNIDDSILTGGGFCATNSIVFRRKTLPDPLPPFFWTSPVGDYPLQLFLAALGPVNFIKDVMSVYRWRVKGSYSEKVALNKDSLDKELMLLEKFNTLLIDFNDYFDGKYTLSVEKRIDIQNKRMHHVRYLRGDFEPFKQHRKSMKMLIKNVWLFIRYVVKGLDGFDKKYYREKNPYVKRFFPLLLHYLISGAYNGANPNDNFNTYEYVFENQELLYSGENPLVHHNNKKKRDSVK